MTIEAATTITHAASDYGAIKSLVSRLVPETRSGASLTAEEQSNLDAFVRYRAAKPAERPLYMTPTCTIHRRGIVHLKDLLGMGGKELNHAAMEGRTNEIQDLVVKGDRVWCVFTLRARHVGELYGVAATGRMLEITEFCVMRFEASKIAEGWFFADELGLCRQLGIPVGVTEAA